MIAPIFIMIVTQTAFLSGLCRWNEETPVLLQGRYKW